MDACGGSETLAEDALKAEPETCGDIVRLNCGYWMPDIPLARDGEVRCVIAYETIRVRSSRI